MQKDCHFYATLCLAKTAGYSDEKAKLLAWANEECDYTLQVKAWNCLWSNLGLYFHFWPGDNNNPKPQPVVDYRYGFWGQQLKESLERKHLICRVDSELSRQIIDEAIEAERAENDCNALCRLGIGLHGLQDNYSHDGWVGKFSRHNVLPAWSHDKFTPSLPFHYGHSPMGKTPDIANAVWYDPRTGETIRNRYRVFDAISKTGEALGITSPPEIYKIFADVGDYERRKQKLREFAGMPDLRFSEIRKDMLRIYGLEFEQAAAAQARIVKEYLK